MEYAKLGDICSKIGSGSTPSGGKDTYQGGGYRLIRSQNVHDLVFCWDGLAEINKVQANKLKNVIVEANDILLNITGDSVARSCITPLEVLPARVNQHVAIIRPNPNILNSYYLLSYLQVNQHYLLALASTGSTRNALTKRMIEKLAIPLISLPIQRKIASILSAYDSLIENNTKRIRLLEQMAENLYKEWFVRFRFPGYETTEFVDGLPKGWKIMRISELLEIKYGKDHKNIQDGNIPIYGSGGVMRYGCKYLYDGLSVLIPRKGSLNNIMLADGKFWTVDTMFYSIPKTSNICRYLYYILSKLDMTSFNAGAALPSMTTDILNKMKITVSHADLLEQFDVTLSKWYAEIQTLKNYNIILTRQRDLLLPRLMSGKLEVKA